MRDYSEFTIDEGFTIRVIELAPDACEVHFKCEIKGLKRFYVNIHTALDVIGQAYHYVFSNAPVENIHMVKIAKRLGFKIAKTIDGINIFELERK